QPRPTASRPWHPSYAPTAAMPSTPGRSTCSRCAATVSAPSHHSSASLISPRSAYQRSTHRQPPQTGPAPRLEQNRTGFLLLPVPFAMLRSAWCGAIDEFLGVAIERPALEQLEVEVTGALENRPRPGPSGDDGKDGHLEAVDQAGGHERPVKRQAGLRAQRHV